MGRRRYYKRRRSRLRIGRSNFVPFIFAIIILVGTILQEIVKNLEVILIGVAILGMYIHSKYRSKVLARKEREERLRKNRTIEQLLSAFSSHPTDFEKHVAEIYESLGYKTEVTKASGDGGKDIIMHKDDKKYVVEVKLYSKTNKIGRPPIQKLHSAMIDCKAEEAIFVTTSDFTSTAREYGNKHGISLVNGDKLVELIDKSLDDEKVVVIDGLRQPTIALKKFKISKVYNFFRS